MRHPFFQADFTLDHAGLLLGLDVHQPQPEQPDKPHHNDDVLLEQQQQQQQHILANDSTRQYQLSGESGFPDHVSAGLVQVPARVHRAVVHRPLVRALHRGRLHAGYHFRRRASKSRPISTVP